MSSTATIWFAPPQPAAAIVLPWTSGTLWFNSGRLSRSAVTLMTSADARNRVIVRGVAVSTTYGRYVYRRATEPPVARASVPTRLDRTRS